MDDDVRVAPRASDVGWCGLPSVTAATRAGRRGDERIARRCRDGRAEAGRVDQLLAQHRRRDGQRFGVALLARRKHLDELSSRAWSRSSGRRVVARARGETETLSVVVCVFKYK